MILKVPTNYAASFHFPEAIHNEVLIAYFDWLGF